MRSVILVLADGLRPDAITPTRMPSLDALGAEYTLALQATTVRPSSTVAALASIATGLSPETHGLIEPGLELLGRIVRIKPLARELARAGVPSRVVTGELTPVEWNVVRALTAAAGVGGLTCAGRRAREVAEVAAAVAERREGGVLFVYLNDCDRAGHAHGWMSREYLEAAVEVDTAVGMLSGYLWDALLVVLADHGGGGVTPTRHHEPHPANDRIPLVLAGYGVTRRHRLTRPVSILDVPPTLCHWLGVPVPAGYEGRALTEAFVKAPSATRVGV